MFQYLVAECGEATKHPVRGWVTKKPHQNPQKNHAQKQPIEIVRHLLVPLLLLTMHRIGLLRKSNPFKEKSLVQTSANYPFYHMQTHVHSPFQYPLSSCFLTSVKLPSTSKDVEEIRFLITAFISQS